MKEYLEAIYYFLDQPLFRIIFIIFFLIMGVHIIVRIIKVINNKDSYFLYDTHTLELISFGLSCANDCYETNYSDEELTHIDHYKESKELEKYINDILRRRYKCSKS